MAVIFLQQKKTQKILILIFIGALIVAAFLIWKGFFKKEIETLSGGIPVPQKQEIKIDFETLKNPLLESLQSFPEIEPFQETVSKEGKVIEKLGRENPFLPY